MHYSQYRYLKSLSYTGKSTILRILGGRHLTKPDKAVTVLGKSAFHDTKLNFERAYLDTDWGMRYVFSWNYCNNDL